MFGIVYDTDGETPLPGAIVIIESDSKSIVTLKTGTNGQFKLEGLFYLNNIYDYTVTALRDQVVIPSVIPSNRVEFYFLYDTPDIQLILPKKMGFDGKIERIIPLK